jgi:hypothetical protein
MKISNWEMWNTIIVVSICFKVGTHETCNHMKFKDNYIKLTWPKKKHSMKFQRV